jgi:hypothetical protein
VWFAADSLEPGASQFTSAVLSGCRSLRPLNASDNHQVHDDPVCGSYYRIETSCRALKDSHDTRPASRLGKCEAVYLHNLARVILST